MSAFWDANAVLRLCVHGQRSPHARELLKRANPTIWWATQVEVLGALARLHREGNLSREQFVASRAKLSTMLNSWHEVRPGAAVRECAIEQIDRFPLKAADALQLAAALVWCKHKPRGRWFVSNDVRLASAALSSGFESLSV